MRIRRFSRHTPCRVKRGFCWIVNNFDFNRSPGNPSNRMGTQIDEESLRRVFTWLGFQVEVVRDATRDQMLSSMKELASKDHSGMDCVACEVLIAQWPHHLYAVHLRAVHISCERGSCQGH
ncbi:unnamed protein product [Arctogadus glacialis]